MEGTVYAGCSCGCGEGFVLKNEFGVVSVYFLSYGFATQQRGFLGQVRRDLDALSGRPIADFTVSREDLARVRDFLKNAEYDGGAPCGNDGHIVFSWDRDFGCVVELYSEQSPLDIILGRRFLCYEHTVGFEEAEKIIAQIDTVLSVDRVFPKEALQEGKKQ